MARGVEPRRDDAARFDDLIPRWMFFVRPPLLRVLVAVALPALAAVPLSFVDEPENLRSAPLLVLSLIAVAAIAGWWPAGLGGVVALVLYWWYGVPPAHSIGKDLSGWIAIGAMAALVAGLAALTRQVQSTVDDVRALDEDRRASLREQAELRRDAEVAAAQTGAVLALAGVLARAHTVADVVDAFLDHVDLPVRPATGSVAVVRDGQLRVIGARNSTPEVIAAIEAVDLQTSSWLGDVLRGEPALIDDRDEFAARHPQARVLSLFPSGSWAVVPFRSEGTTGLLSVHYIEPQPLRRHALYFSLVAELLATALERTQAEELQALQLTDLEQSLAERDRIARTLSTTLLPPSLPRLTGFEAAAWLIPASADEVAGDFYDLFAVNDGEWVAVLGDVCGKGAEAAAVTSLARYAARVAALTDPDPRHVAEVANVALVEDRSDLFCTMVIVHYRRELEAVEVALAGHLQARLVRADGVQRLGQFSAALGYARQPPPIERHAFERGDAIVVFSDGLIERRSDFGEDELDRELCRWYGHPPAAIAGALEQRVRSSATERRDDVAVLVIGRTA